MLLVYLMQSHRESRLVTSSEDAQCNIEINSRPLPTCLGNEAIISVIREIRSAMLFDIDRMNTVSFL
jgi:hypothetical protein